MARIRTIKPEFFVDEDLFDMDIETGLPCRLAFIGLWTHADRRGRFEWKPREIKIAIMPHDDFDVFSRVMDALTTRGFIVKYEHQNRAFGAVRTFEKHQVINNRESESHLPPPPDSVLGSKTHASSTREPHVNNALKHASTTRAQGKGKEGKGKEGKKDSRKQSVNVAPAQTENYESAPSSAAHKNGSGRSTEELAAIRKRLQAEKTAGGSGIAPITNFNVLPEAP